MSFRRSTRSTITPATGPASTQGRKAKAAAKATASGSRVIETAASGSAANVIPSPRFDSAAAVQKRQ